jgi:hypothetical protein
MGVIELGEQVLGLVELSLLLELLDLPALFLA